MLLCQNQHEFRRQKETTHVVQNLLDTITEIATKDKVTIATYIDLSKAFDCLQYDQLFVKMRALGYHEMWFLSYLPDRTQCLELEGTISQEKIVQLGVPQGSILGPILLLIYINHMSNADTENKFIKFADDTTILTDGATLEEAATKMNGSLQKADLWFQRNKLNLNPAKTRYKIFDSKTEETNQVKIRDQFIKRVWEKGINKSFK